MDFLPQNYEVPTSGGSYMKLKPGENRFRILGPSIIGWEYWIDVDGGRKPIRVEQLGKINTGDADPSEVKHFWAFPVWNTNEAKVQVLELTQASIQREIKNLAKDKDWGNIYDYDISVTKTGEGMETRYSVTPKPKKELPEEAKKEWERVQASGFDITALFESGDPFTWGAKGIMAAPEGEINIDEIEF